MSSSRGAKGYRLVVTMILSFQVTTLAFQPMGTSHSRSLSLLSSPVSRHFAYAPTMASRSIGDDESEEFAPFSSPSFASQALSFLPDSKHIPPQTRDLFAELSENYIFNSRRRPVTLEQVLQVIEAEHIPLDVPIKLDTLMIDVKLTGDEVDESVAEILSLAAMYALPKDVTLYLLDSCILRAVQDDARSELQRCRDIFADKGWKSVSFPKGLALQVMKKYEPPQKGRRSPITPFFLLRRQRRRIEQAKEAVLLAATTLPPKQRFESRQDFFRSMEEELLDDSASVQSRVLVGNNKNLFFPKRGASDMLRRGLRKVTRTADKQYARLKSSGRAGIVSYCFLNLVFYTIGVVWQWQRLGPPLDPLQAPSVTAALLKKFAKVFGSLYVASQFTKLPKVFAAVALTPLAQRAVNSTKKNLRVSETFATVLLVGMQYIIWLGIVTVPILSEYTRLRRLVELERFIDIKQVAPAFYTAVSMGILQEC